MPLADGASAGKTGLQQLPTPLPRSISSIVQVRAKERTAALVALYVPEPGIPLTGTTASTALNRSANRPQLKHLEADGVFARTD